MNNLPSGAELRTGGSQLKNNGAEQCSAPVPLARNNQMGLHDQKEILDILDFVGLSREPKKKAGKFSLGMKQRLGIGMALLGSPEFLLLDEPINGLDPQGIIEMRELIKRLNEEKNMTIMRSSHILGELQKVATVFGIISEGKLVTEVTAEELKNSYIGEADSLEEFYLDIIRKGQKAC